jgi:hypothetical protein
MKPDNPTHKHTHLQAAQSQHSKQSLQTSVLPPTLNRLTTKTKEEYRTDNITYTQTGGSCFVGMESGKFKVQLFVESLVLKIPASV